MSKEYSPYNMLYFMVKEFHQAYGLPVEKVLTKQEQTLRNSLEIEERAELLKEVCDLAYVVVGTDVSKKGWDGFSETLIFHLQRICNTLGMDFVGAFQEVHQSNMSKLGEDGKPIYREDGKVLKGPNYKAADVRKYIGKHNVREYAN
jgi:predicted HAD superfamily Cof-like phosphohydrolase